VHVIATAGHVDHGKSTLVRALTGMEPDRWVEERRRGMTIDLGYAWTTLPGGTVVAFVDVPGHQRFVTNMLAGVGPVPAVLFVLAADEGWSAQSTEHLEALDALQVCHGVLAISRCDLGDAELAEAEARDYLDGTGLASMPAVAVSPVTGAGLDQLRAAIGRMVSSLPERVESSTRLWIDRVFSIRGAGTIVTGTLSSGVVQVGDHLEVHPSGALVRVRGIESLKEPVDRAYGVARVALNLRGVKPSQLRRGDALTGPGQWLDVAVMDVRLRGAERIPSELILHVGSAAVPARVRRLGEDTARLTLARPLPVHIGERGVLRDPGAQRIAAAAVVLDPLPPALTNRGAARHRALELTDMTGQPDLAGEIRRRGAVRRHDLVLTGVPIPPDALRGKAVAVDDWLIETARWRQWREQLVIAVGDWAQAHPLLPGTPRQAVIARLKLPDPALLNTLVKEEPDLVLDREGVHRRDQQASLPLVAQRELARMLERLDSDLFDAPEAPELAAAGLSEKLLAVATRDGRLLRVASGIYLRPATLDEAVRRLSKLDQPFTLAQARQALGTTRRVAMPLLELLDHQRRTVRLDSRVRKVRDLPGSGSC
jgi:selenocysteine-specific elongation factor